MAKKNETVSEPKNQTQTKQKKGTTNATNTNNSKVKKIEKKQKKDVKKDKKTEKENKKEKEEKNIKNPKKKVAKDTKTTKKDQPSKDKKVEEEKEKVKKEKLPTKKDNVKEEQNAIVSKKTFLKIEELKEAIKKKKRLPKEEIEKINKIVYRNIIIATVIVLYFIFLNLGHMNIKNDIYVTDLKVFGMCILLAAIALIESAYKKESSELAIYGVEMIALSISTITLIYVNLMQSSRYIYILPAISYVFAIYYLIKSIVIYQKKKHLYFINDMKEIMNKEE